MGVGGKHRVGVECREELLGRGGHGVVLRLEISQGPGAKGLQGLTGKGLEAPGEAMVKNHIQGNGHQSPKGLGRQDLQGPKSRITVGDAVDIAMERKAPGKAGGMGAGKGSGKEVSKKGAEAEVLIWPRQYQVGQGVQAAPWGGSSGCSM